MSDEIYPSEKVRENYEKHVSQQIKQMYRPGSFMVTPDQLKDLVGAATSDERERCVRIVEQMLSGNQWLARLGRRPNPRTGKIRPPSPPTRSKCGGGMTPTYVSELSASAIATQERRLLSRIAGVRVSG